MDFEGWVAGGADCEFGEKKNAVVEAAAARGGAAKSGSAIADDYGAAAAGGGGRGVGPAVPDVRHSRTYYLLPRCRDVILQEHLYINRHLFRRRFDGGEDHGGGVDVIGDGAGRIGAAAQPVAKQFSHPRLGPDVLFEHRERLAGGSVVRAASDEF